MPVSGVVKVVTAPTFTHVGLFHLFDGLLQDFSQLLGG